MTKDTREIVERAAAKAAWNDNSVVQLLTMFIANKAIDVELEAFLAERMRDENPEPQHSAAPWQEFPDPIWLEDGNNERTGETWYGCGGQRHIAIQDAHGLPVCLIVADEDDENVRPNVELIKRAPGTLEILEKTVPWLEELMRKIENALGSEELDDLIDAVKRQTIFARRGAP